MKRFLLALICIAMLVKMSWAASYIAIPDLVYDNGIMNYGISNADIKGSIIKSGKFKVMNTPKNFNVDATIEAINAKQSAEADAQASSAPKEFQLGKPIKQQNTKDPKYILVGQVVTADLHDNYYKVQGTDNSTGTRTLNISVNYHLINIADNSIVSSFNVSATGTQTSILRLNDGDKLQTNQGKLIKDTSQDLAQQVMNELSNVDTKSDDSGSALVKKFTTYDE